MRATLIASVALLFLAGQARADWASLWYRPDQQGERTLQAGDPKRAAELFTDPRRQAYAQLMAHQYDAAAKRLAPFADAESQYNRGNALARSGDLTAALASYDAALKHPDLEPALHRDAEHNRDLVARQLKAQQNPSGESGSKDGKPQERPPQGAGQQQHGAGQQAQSAGQQQQGAGEQQQGAGQGSNSKAPEPVPPQQAHADENAGPGSVDRPSAAKSEEDKEDKGESARASNGQPLGEASAPQTEQQLALEQWLRQIPDDPGGLLRRKFLVEHMMKQQQAGP